MDFYLAVELINGIIRVPVVLKLNESEVLQNPVLNVTSLYSTRLLSHLLEQHVGGAAELTEELLQVPLSCPGGHVAYD